MEKQSTSRLLKLVVSAFALFLLLTCGVLLSACGGEEHVHAYEKTDSKAIATCGATGYDVYTCSCGDQYAIVTAATGKHTFTNGRCTVCGIPDTFDATALQAKLDEINRTVDGQHKSISDSLNGIDSALDELHIHKFVAVEDATVDPTCMAGGFTYAVCECGSSSVTKITQALGHDWKDDDTLTQAATCTSAGMTYQRCSRCGETKEKAAIAPVEHEWVEDETRTIPATCTTAGQKIEKCANCDATRAGAAIEALGHTWKMNGEGEDAVEGTVVAPTCTVGGYTRHECTVCGFSYDDTFTAAAEHTWVEDPSREMAPTCTDYGQKWERCSVCNLTRQAETIAPTGHNLGDPVEHPSTCTESGFERRTCQNANCDYFEDTITDPASHTWNEGVKTEATCLVDGYTTYTCTVCKATKVEKGEPATGEHHYTVLVDTIVGDCQKHTSYVYKCTTCKSTNIVVGPLGDHKFETQLSKQDATCTDDGLIVWQCSVCAKETKEEGIPALKHNFEGVEYKVKQEATCEADGLEAAKCTRCDEEITKPIPRKDHTVSDETKVVYNYIDVDPTNVPQQVGDKNTKYYVCWICEECQKEVVKVEAAAEEDPATPTYKWRLRDDSDIKEEWHSWVKTTGEGEKEPTCTEGGLYWYVCNDTNCSAIVDGKPLKVSLPQEKLLHNFEGEHKVTVDPTCVAPGTVTFKCTRCETEFTMTLESEDEGVTYVLSFEDDVTSDDFDEASRLAMLDLIEEMKPLGHDWQISKEPVREFCGDIGVTEYTCSRCEETKEENSEPLPHAELAYYTEYGFCGMKTADHSVIKYGYCTRCGEIITSERIDTNARHFVFNRTEIAKIVADWENMEPEEKLAARVEYAKVWNEIEKWYDLGYSRNHHFVDDLVPYLVTLGARDCREGYSVVCFDCFTSLYTVAATEHKFDKTVEPKAATCLGNGTKGYKHCSLCGLYLDYASEEALKNEDGEYADEKEAEALSIIYALGHKFVKGTIIKGDCTHGSYEGWYCEVCFNGGNGPVAWDDKYESDPTADDLITTDKKDNDLVKYLATLGDADLAEFGRGAKYSFIAEKLGADKDVEDVNVNVVFEKDAEDNYVRGATGHKWATEDKGNKLNPCEANAFTVNCSDTGATNYNQTKQKKDGYSTYCEICGELKRAEDHKKVIYKYTHIKGAEAFKGLETNDEGEYLTFTIDQIKKMQEENAEADGTTYYYENVFTCWFVEQCTECGKKFNDHPHVNPAGHPDLIRYQATCSQDATCFVCGTVITRSTGKHTLTELPSYDTTTGEFTYREGAVELSEAEEEILKSFIDSKGKFGTQNPYSTLPKCNKDGKLNKGTIVYGCLGCMMTQLVGNKVTWTACTGTATTVEGHTHKDPSTAAANYCTKVEAPAQHTYDDTKAVQKFYAYDNRTYTEVTVDTVDDYPVCLYAYYTAWTRVCEVCGHEYIGQKDAQGSFKAEKTTGSTTNPTYVPDYGESLTKSAMTHYVVPVLDYYGSENYTPSTEDSSAIFTFRCVVCGKDYSTIPYADLAAGKVDGFKLLTDEEGFDEKVETADAIFDIEDDNINATLKVSYLTVVEATDEVPEHIEFVDATKDTAKAIKLRLVDDWSSRESRPIKAIALVTSEDGKEKVTNIGELVRFQDAYDTEEYATKWSEKVTDADSFMTEVKKGGEIVLGDDTDLSEAQDHLRFKSEEVTNVTLDLAGNTLTLANDKGLLVGGGDQWDGSKVTIKDGTIKLGTGENSILQSASKTSELTLENVVIDGKECTSTEAIHVGYDGKLVMKNCYVTAKGRVLGTNNIEKSGNITLEDCIFVSNESTALYFPSAGTLTATNCTFYGLNAGVYLRGKDSTATFTNCKFYKGNSEKYGSDKEDQGSNMKYYAALVIGNGKGYGTGEDGYRGIKSVTLTNCTFDIATYTASAATNARIEQVMQEGVATGEYEFKYTKYSAGSDGKKHRLIMINQAGDFEINVNLDNATLTALGFTKETNFTEVKAETDDGTGTVYAEKGEEGFI